MVYKTILLILLGITVNAQIMLNPDRAGTLGGEGNGGSEEGEVFAEDFEDGTLDAWALQWEAGNSIAIATDTVNNGTYSVKFVYGGSNNLNVMSIPVDNLNSIYFRCYMRWVVNMTFGDGYPTADIMHYYDDVLPLANARIKCDADDEPRNWDITANATDYGENYDAIISGDWFRLEVGWERGTGVDGWVEIRVDGDSICGTYAVDRLYNVDSLKIGNYLSNEFPNGHIYMDDIVVDSTDWVGIKP